MVNYSKILFFSHGSSLAVERWYVPDSHDIVAQQLVGI
jgi:hypothetical protein